MFMETGAFEIFMTFIIILMCLMYEVFVTRKKQVKLMNFVTGQQGLVQQEKRYILILKLHV